MMVWSKELKISIFYTFCLLRVKDKVLILCNEHACHHFAWLIIIILILLNIAVIDNFSGSKYSTVDEKLHKNYEKHIVCLFQSISLISYFYKNIYLKLTCVKKFQDKSIHVVFIFPNSMT
jgi:hypothetical protein